MKRSHALGLLFIGLMLVSAVPSAPVHAAASYTESLNVYIAGNNAMWFMSFGGINVTNKVATAENVQGVTAYNVTAIKTTGWKTDFQVFGPQGYGLVPTPFVPVQGIFLTVSADSFASAKSEADSLDPWLLTAFASYSNGTVYTFYSPFSFDSIVTPTLLAQMPKHVGGFTDAISTSAFVASASPIVELQGHRVGSTFQHNLVLSSMGTEVLDSSLRPKVVALFGSSVLNIHSSNSSTSSVVKVHFLDGVINSTDTSAVFSRNTANFSGLYSLTLAPNKKVFQLNVTVAEVPPQLSAYRTVSKGVLHTNDTLAVTVWLTNLSPSTGLTNVQFTDNWWTTTHVFQYVSGNYSVTLNSMAANTSKNLVYVLKYNGTAPQRITIPAGSASYTFKIGTNTFHAKSYLNNIPLSLGVDDAVVYLYTVPTGGASKAVGSPQGLKVFVSNIGTVAATNVVAAGQPLTGLGAGSTTPLALKVAPENLLQVNQTKVYSVTYQNPGGTPFSSTSNVFNEVFSHTAMQIGLPVVTVAQGLSDLPGGRVNLTLTYTTSNKGVTNLHGFVATQTFPAGMGCGTFNATLMSCSNGVVTLNYSTIETIAPKTAVMKYNLSGASNIFLPPVSYSVNSSGYTFTGKSNFVASPVGLEVTKTFALSQLFPGMTSQVKVVVLNNGPFRVFNSTFVSQADSPLDTITGTATPSGRAASLVPGANLTFSYTISAASTGTNVSASPVISSFYFAGTPFAVAKTGATLSVYPPLSATITTSPAKVTEGTSFTLSMTVTNPSGVPVSAATFTLPVPSGLSVGQLQGATLSGGVITFSPGSLGAHQSTSATAQVVASSGIAIDFSKAHLTFGYNGQTINGKLPTKGITIGENVTTRYLVPTGIVLVVLLAAAFYIRRLARVSAPASQN